MATYWFQCKKCSTLIKKDSNPSTLGCSANTLHQWQKLAEVGNTNYQCKKCGTLIQAKSTPTTLGCLANTLHQWQKL